MPEAPPSLHVLVAAPATAPGVEPTLEDVVARARAGHRVAVLFTEAGLELLTGTWPARLAAAGVATSMCARSARVRKVDPMTVLPTVRWSSLTAFLRDRPEGDRLWSVFP
jgi:hypothetical protein